MKKSFLKIFTAAAVGAIAVVTACVFAACGNAMGNMSQIGKTHVNFLTLTGDAYIKVANADIIEDNGTITVKVPNNYDMVNKGVEVDLKGFFTKHDKAWGKDLYFRRSDNSYAANEVGRAYELKDGTSDTWVRAGITPEEVWTDNGGAMSSRVMLCKGADGKVLNYIFFANATVTQKEVVFTIRTDDKLTYTMTVAVEKKGA